MKRGRPRKALPHFLGTLSLIGWRPKTKADYALVPAAFLKKRGPKRERLDDERLLNAMVRQMMADYSVTRFGAAYLATGASRPDERGKHPPVVRRLALKFAARGLEREVRQMRRAFPPVPLSTKN